MRITFIVAHADLSGGVKVIASYAGQLAQRGHDVVVVSRPPRRALLREKVRSALRGRPLPTAARRGPSHLDNVPFTHQIIDSHRPISTSDVPDADVVIATYWETARWVAALPPSKGAKAYFIQGYETRDDLPPETLDETWRLPMHKIVIARWLARMSEERFGDQDYSLVPNAVDLEQFSAPPRGKQPSPTVGMVYTHVTSKGCDIAVKAVEIAKKSLPNLKLIAFGTRTPTGDLPLPAGSEFVLQPAQSAIKDLYAKADAWIFSSRQEGFGLPLLEAMACRTPIVATPAGAAPEILADGGGVLVAPESAPSLAAGICQIVGMVEEDWRQLSDKALQIAGRYNWTHSADLFEAALRRAVEKSEQAVDSRF